MADLGPVTTTLKVAGGARRRQLGRRGCWLKLK